MVKIRHLLHVIKNKYMIERPNKGPFWLRLIFTLLGCSVCAFSVGLFRMARFGVDPFQALLSGLDYTLTDVPFSTISLSVYIVMLIFDVFMDRSLLGVGTIIMMVLNGYIVEFSHKLLLKLFPTVALPGRIAFISVGIVLMCLAAAFYTSSDLGVSPYDAVALAISGKVKKVQFRVIRIISDTLCVSGGILLYLLAAGGTWQTLGNVAGIGTIIAAFCMGPLIQFFCNKIAMPLLIRRY